MFGRELNYTSPFYSQTSMMLPYDVPIPQPYPSPYPVTQPYFQNYSQTIDVPTQHTIQPIIMPTPVAVPYPQAIPIPIDRPCAVPFPQPVAVPVDRPYAVPVPIPMPVSQPIAVPQPFIVQEQVPVPVPFPVPVPTPYPYNPQQGCCMQPTARPVEYVIEEPVRIIRRHRRRRRCRSYSRTPPPALAPIVIPIQMQAAAPAPAPAYQVIEYIQDIYPPAQVFTEQVPVGYMLKNSGSEQSGFIQSQSNSNIMLPSSAQAQQVQVVQELPNGQLVQRTLTVDGVNVRSAIY